MSRAQTLAMLLLVIHRFKVAVQLDRLRFLLLKNILEHLDALRLLLDKLV